MEFTKEQNNEIRELIKELQVFIELSLRQENSSLKDWIDETINKLDGRCYLMKHCNETNCPAYKNECGRCWLIAGTLCGGKPQGKFVEKYRSCTECEVFLDVIGDDPVRKLREMVIILIYSLKMKNDELIEAQADLKVLKGLLPICSTCKRIREENGSWSQFEFFIDTHSEAQFSHGLCPDCAKEHFPQYYQRIKNKKELSKKDRR